MFLEELQNAKGLATGEALSVKRQHCEGRGRDGDKHKR